MTPVRIAELAASDHTRWRELWHAYLNFYETALPEPVYENTWRRLLDPSEPVCGLGAYDANGRLTGITHYFFHPTCWSLADVCYLQDLFVDAAARGGGFGRALIAGVAERARLHGAGKLYWMTHESNATARRLYARVADYNGSIVYEMPLA